MYTLFGRITGCAGYFVVIVVVTAIVKCVSQLWSGDESIVDDDNNNSTETRNVFITWPLRTWRFFFHLLSSLMINDSGDNQMRLDINTLARMCLKLNDCIATQHWNVHFCHMSVLHIHLQNDTVSRNTFYSNSSLSVPTRNITFIGMGKTLVIQRAFNESNWDLWCDFLRFGHSMRHEIIWSFITLKKLFIFFFNPSDLMFNRFGWRSIKSIMIMTIKWSFLSIFSSIREQKERWWRRKRHFQRAKTIKRVFVKSLRQFLSWFVNLIFRASSPLFCVCISVNWNGQPFSFLYVHFHWYEYMPYLFSFTSVSADFFLLVFFGICSIQIA